MSQYSTGLSLVPTCSISKQAQAQDVLTRETSKENQAIRECNNAGGDLERSQNGGQRTDSNPVYACAYVGPCPLVKQAHLEV